MPFTDAASAKQYLATISDHPSRAGDTSNLHPDFAIRLANSLEQANQQGMNLRMRSGYRGEGETGSDYDESGKSAHTYGLASDINGLDGANGEKTKQWAQIAANNGLSNPYTIGNAKEFNHWQLPPQPLETTPTLLNSLKFARASGDVNKVYAAYDANSGGNTSPASGGATQPGQDNRQAVFNMLTSKEVGLTPQQALGAMWSMGGESGGTLSATAYGPGDPGGAYGMGQWTGGSHRRQNLEAFAQAQGKPASDAATQVAFIQHELLGDHAYVLNHLKLADSAESAAHVWTAEYEAPKVDNSEKRIADGKGHMATLDANNNLVLGDAKPVSYPSTSTKPASGGQTPNTVGGAAAQAAINPWLNTTPEQRFGMSIGEALSNIGSSGGGGRPEDPADQPAIRSMALEGTETGPQTSPVPAEFAGGVGGQLGQLGASTVGQMPDPTASITAGAPSMTSMLGTLGTSSNFNMMDPRAIRPPATAMMNPNRLF